MQCHTNSFIIIDVYLLCAQVLSNHDSFKDAQLETYQPIEFLSDEVTFEISRPSGSWKISTLNSPVVSINSIHRIILL